MAPPPRQTSRLLLTVGRFSPVPHWPVLGVPRGQEPHRDHQRFLTLQNPLQVHPGWLSKEFRNPPQFAKILLLICYRRSSASSPSASSPRSPRSEPHRP